MGIHFYKGSSSPIHVNDRFFVSSFDHNLLSLMNNGPYTAPTSINGESGGIALDAIVVSPESLSTTSTSSETLDHNEESITSRGSSTTNGGIIACSDFHVQFPLFQKKLEKQNINDENDHNEKYVVLLQINNVVIDPSFLSMALPPMNSSANNDSKSAQCLFKQGNSNKPSTETLEKLLKDQVLHAGKNSIRYMLAKVSHSSDNKVSNDSESQNKDSTAESTKTLLEYEPIDTVEAYVYLWSVHDCVIVVDIDGTITQSDVKGVISSIITEDYEHVHNGVCSFFSNLVQDQSKILNNEVVANDEAEIGDLTTSEESKKDARLGNVRVLYLSARPIKLMHTTRKFLAQLSQSPFDQQRKNERGMKQIQSCLCHYPTVDDEDEYDFCEGEEENENTKQAEVLNVNTDDDEGKSDPKMKLELKGGSNGSSIDQLPDGPIFLHPANLRTVLKSELITKDIHEYKSNTLIRKVVTPFIAAGKKTKHYENSSSSLKSFDASQIFAAGFGNTKKDAMAYTKAGIEKQNIFIINKKSEVVTGEVELAASDSLSTGIEEKLVNISKVNDHNSDTVTVTMKQTYRGYDDPDLTQALMQRIENLMA